MLPLLRKFAAAIFLGLLSSPACVAEQWDGLREGVLVLRNGQLLSGGITPVGDKYVVTVGEKGELRVPVRDVEMHCRDLDEVYLRKRSAFAQTDVTAHLELADWCLRHSLLSRAADELLAAMAIRRDHPGIPPLERRLNLAVSKPLATMQSKRSRSPSVSLDELERTMRELPDDVVRAFTAHVQPLLVNRCASNACHGSGSDSTFRLVRPSWGKTLTRRFTQRNLNAALLQVNRESPEKSPLLTAPSGPHGNIGSAMFGPRDQHQLEVLARWVEGVARDDESPPATITSGSPNLLQAGFEEPVAFPQVEDDSPANATLSGRETQAASDAKTSDRLPGGFVPRDPFDPEIFNRRFLRPRLQE